MLNRPPAGKCPEELDASTLGLGTFSPPSHAAVVSLGPGDYASGPIRPWPGTRLRLGNKGENVIDDLDDGTLDGGVRVWNRRPGRPRLGRAPGRSPMATPRPIWGESCA